MLSFECIKNEKGVYFLLTSAYNADMGRNQKIGSAHLQLFTNLISVFYVYTKLETVSYNMIYT